MIRNNQQPTCTNVTCENQALTIKECPHGGTPKKLLYQERYKNATSKDLRSRKDNKNS